MTDPSQLLSIDATSHVRIAPSVYARSFGGEMVVLDFGRGEYYGLDEVGSLAWQLLERGESLGAVAGAISERWDVSPEEALRDLVDLVTHMHTAALLVVEPPAGSTPGSTH